MSEEFRIPDPVAVRAWRVDTFDALRAHLDALNADGVGEAVVLEREGIIAGHTGMWLAYCTDPDGEWFIESSDPSERTHDDEGYERIELGYIASRGPFRVLDSRTLQLPPIEFDRGDPSSTLWALYQASARGEAFMLAGREYAPVGSSARVTFRTEP